MPVAFPWLRLAPWVIILALIGTVAVFNDRLKAAHAATEACEAQRKADRAAYETAQAQAKAKNIEQVRSKEQKQEAANAEAVSNLSARLERLRSELRAQAGAPKGGAGSAGVSEAEGGSEAVGEARVCFSPAVVLRGAENEERHDELITLVEQLIRITNE